MQEAHLRHLVAAVGEGADDEQSVEDAVRRDIVSSPAERENAHQQECCE